MATKTKDDAAPPETLPALTGGVNLPAGFEDDMFDGAGTSSSADDSVIPFLKLLQDMSPEAQSRHEKYIDGAEVGALLNTATRQLWLPEGRGREEQPCFVVPVAFERSICQWRPDRGGLAGKHPLRGSLEETMKYLGGVYVIDPRDPKKEKRVWKLNSEDGDDLTDTRYQYAVTLDGEQRDQVSPVVMSFSSSGHKAARAWMALQRKPVPGRGVPKAWGRTYLAKRTTQQNAKGNWFVLNMQLVGMTEDKGVRDYCRAMYESIASGSIRAAEEDVEAAPPGAAQDHPDDVPF